MSRGRPTKFNPEIAAKILEKVRKGNYLPEVGAALGVHHSTIRKWINRGGRTGGADRPYREFRDGYKKARAEAINALEECVQKAGEKDPKIALEILERLRPERWGTHKNRLRRLEQELADIRATIAGGGQEG